MILNRVNLIHYGRKTQRKSVMFFVAIALLNLFGCSTIPIGKSKVALIDSLVVKQEFGQIQKLLADIDTRDPEFEALVIRRRAVRPLISQFEHYTVQHAAYLQSQDLWPQSLAFLQSAEKKLPESAALKDAKEEFYHRRTKRLEQIQHQIGLLEGQSQVNKTPLVAKILEVHPTGFSGRWQSFQHGRKNRGLARELITCGQQALIQQSLDLAEACFSMAQALSDEFDVSEQIAFIAKSRKEKAEKAERLAQQEIAIRDQERRQKINILKQQYIDLAAAEWLLAAKQALVQLRLLAPEDKEIKSWAIDLQIAIDQEVQESITRGQALYSIGNLESALSTWEQAAQLDPQNPILKGHIARAERFLEKLNRLNKS